MCTHTYISVPFLCNPLQSVLTSAACPGPATALVTTMIASKIVLTFNINDEYPSEKTKILVALTNEGE
jgi:hypothetical protein